MFQGKRIEKNMNKISTFLQHRRLQRMLVLYVDNELPQSELAQMHRHVENCAACRQRLAEIHACRELLQAGKTSPIVPTEQLWLRLARRIVVPSPKRIALSAPAQLRFQRWAVVTVVLLLLSVAIWKKAGWRESTLPLHAQAAIDYGIFLTDLRQEVAEPKFYKRYPAQVVKLAEAQQAIAFPLADIAALPPSFSLDCVRVLECNGRKCIQFTYRKPDKVINIFQHALGQPWTFGPYAQARTPICNVECLLVNARNLAALSWQGKNSEYLAVGELTPEELEQVVHALR